MRGAVWYFNPPLLFREGRGLQGYASATMRRERHTAAFYDAQNFLWETLKCFAKKEELLYE